MIFIQKRKEDYSRMKKITALLLCIIMLAGVLCSCTTLKKGDKGMAIDIYLSSELYDFDPATAYTDASMAKVFSMIYEGLTRLDSKGGWQKALMTGYSFKEIPDKNEYKLRIDLGSTKWTDGRTVQAADFVFAWKRILDPEFPCEAAALLYDVKNAQAAKLGDVSIDDVGVKAVETYVLEITFNYKVDIDRFMLNLASPALVPLREDVVLKSSDWAKKATTIVSNGPFAVKENDNGKTLRIERSSYYYLKDGASSNAKEPLDKYVIPYRLVTKYSTGDLNSQLEAYKNGKVLYLGEIPLSARQEYKKQAVVTDELNTHTYYFNNNNKLFSDARVRKALSMAIDREKIANEIVVFAKAASGLVPGKVFDANSKTYFRNKGGDLISTSADVAGAKALLAEAKVNGGAFALSVRDNEVDVAIAEYVASVWKELGFNVSINKLASKSTSTDGVYTDEFNKAYMAGDFDVIAVDMQLLSPTAITALAPFALEYSGNGVDMNSATYDLYSHVTGYASEEYNALIKEAYAEKDETKRTEILHRAEEMLLNDMPVMPIIFTQDAYLVNKQLSGIGKSYFGASDFTRMTQKNYYKYKMENATEEAE